MRNLHPIHPFPARMAPDIAFEVLAEIAPRTVLDPMAGSGTALRVASDEGCQAIGFDLDPLAVLISRAWTTPVPPDQLTEAAKAVVARARRLSSRRLRLPWIDDDDETRQFVEYWFAERQRQDLRRLAYVLNHHDLSPVNTALWVAFSRMIITKDSGASLARDVSHSRPHRVKSSSDYDVFAGFEKAAAVIARRLEEQPPKGNVSVERGDARHLDSLPDNHVDLVITSPPYLNAIDYLRGHRLSLVWMGYRLSQLREIRGQSVGSERGLWHNLPDEAARHLTEAGPVEQLPPRYRAIVARYVLDLSQVIHEAARVLKPGGHLVLVMGDTSIRGVYVRNSAIARSAAAAAGLRLKATRTRDILAHRRYLPPPSGQQRGIQRRIGTETILTFRKSA